MKNRLLLLCIIAGFTAHAQTTSQIQQHSHSKDSSELKYFHYVEQMPQPMVDINEYIRTHLLYPELARKNKIQGRVMLRFIVNEDGSISDLRVLRGIGGGCDEEAKRVVMALPKWKPGKQDGRSVKVYYNLPIDFKLTDTVRVNNK